MVDALDAGALIGGVALQHAFGLLHPDIEIERQAVDVRGTQGAALMRNVREGGRQVPAAEPDGGAVEIFLAGDLETDSLDLGLAGRAQHDRMVVALLEPAQVDRIRTRLADEKSETIDIEGARGGKIAHAELDMAHRTIWNGGSRLGVRIGMRFQV
jgi:hypothetical protein